MEARERILIVDDDAAQGKTLARVLEMEGYRAQVVENGQDALQSIDRGPYDLVLSDLKMPGMDGLELHRAIQDRRPDLPVMIVTAHGTIENAIESVREGVVDFIQKPVYADELIHRFSKVFRERKLTEENEELKSRLVHRDRDDAMVGSSDAINGLREQIGRVAKSEATVLILGESGAGKELVADAIHFQSNRAGGPLVKLNCAAIPENLLEDELFGHEKGAFTGADDRRKGRFELAHGGTLFLDEIGELPLGLQTKLLRLLQERTFERLGGTESISADVRVLCATNQDLAARVADGSFREDLYYRINVVPIDVPALRVRGDDVVVLARHFAREAGERNGRRVESLSAEAIAKLQNHNWPGNIRELRNAIERAVIMGSGGTLEADQLQLQAPTAVDRTVGTNGSNGSNGTNGHGESDGLVGRLLNSEIPFEDFEREILVRALERTRGNQTRAARLLGMTRRTLQYRIDKFDIDCAPMRQ